MVVIGSNQCMSTATDRSRRNPWIRWTAMRKIETRYTIFSGIQVCARLSTPCSTDAASWFDKFIHSEDMLLNDGGCTSIDRLNVLLCTIILSLGRSISVLWASTCPSLVRNRSSTLLMYIPSIDVSLMKIRGDATKDTPVLYLKKQCKLIAKISQIVLWAQMNENGNFISLRRWCHSSYINNEKAKEEMKTDQRTTNELMSSTILVRTYILQSVSHQQ